jgi:hypothetical protein
MVQCCVNYILEFVFIIILKNISAIILIYVLSYSSLVGLIIGCLLAVAIIVVIVLQSSEFKTMVYGAMLCKWEIMYHSIGFENK